MAKKDVRPRFREAAMSLFLERGYDATTTADVAERAGITERTLFRYFSDKRELVFDDEASGYELLLMEVERAPAGLGALDALFHAFAAIEGKLISCREVMEPRRRLIESSSALQEREATKLLSLTDELAKRLVDRGAGQLESSMAARIGIIALADAVKSWFDDPACGVGERLDRSRASLRSMVAPA